VFYKIISIKIKNFLVLSPALEIPLKNFHNILNNLRCKQNHAFAPAQPNLSPATSADEFAQLYNCLPLDCAKKAEPLNHEISQAQNSQEICE
jgi:hypothetical protein